MVDFNNEKTIGTPAVDIVRVLILEKRQHVFDAVEAYNKLEYANVDADLAVVRARYVTYYLELQAFVHRRHQPESPVRQAIEKPINATTTTKHDIIKGIINLNNELDTINLIKIDTRKAIDTTRVVQEDESKGL